MENMRCPNCENDLTEKANYAIIACVTAGSQGTAYATCPHCGEELSIDVRFSASIARREEYASAR